MGSRGDKAVTRWRSERLEREVTLVRWGSFGRPVILFPTAGGAGLDGAAAVPEPSALACLVAAATGALTRRRRARG
jgi:hypothetical protein